MLATDVAVSADHVYLEAWWTMVLVVDCNACFAVSTDRAVQFTRKQSSSPTCNSSHNHSRCNHCVMLQ